MFRCKLKSPSKTTYFSSGKISSFNPGSCFPNWLHGNPRMVKPRSLSSSCSAFSSEWDKKNKQTNRALGRFGKTSRPLFVWPFSMIMKSKQRVTGLDQRHLLKYWPLLASWYKGHMFQKSQTLTQILEGKSSEGGHVDNEDVLPGILTEGNVQTFSQRLPSIVVYGAIHSLVT